MPQSRLRPLAVYEIMFIVAEMPLHLLTHAEQVANHLRAEILSGRWQREMPGVNALKKELGVNHVTINAAMRLLEAQGLLLAQGARRPRLIQAVRPRPHRQALQVRLLPYDSENRQSPHNIELVDQLHQSGFQARFARRSLLELGMDPVRVARMVDDTKADAWIVVAGSREVLEWFSGQSFPALALFGRFSGLPIAAASPRAANAIKTAVRRLVSLGHRRIVMLAREERRKPTPALVEQVFLDELEALGIPTGPFHLPDWDDTPTCLMDCLDELYRHTPPTALICGEPRLLAAAQQHLARRGIHSPGKVSLISSMPDPTLAWCRPQIAHIDWDSKPVIQRVVRWVRHIASGREDRRQTLFESRFVEGGTIGPALQR